MSNEYSEKQRIKEQQAKIDYDNCSLTPQQRLILAHGNDSNKNNGFHSHTNGTDNSGYSIIKNGTKDEPTAAKSHLHVANHFDYSSLDTREDIVRDCIKSGGNLNALIKEFVLHDLAAAQSQVIMKFANLIINAPNPKVELEAILKASGVISDSGESLATEYCITRQAISRKVQSKVKQLGLPEETRGGKKPSSKAIYRKTNHGNYKI
jgi:hypothetical protein